MKTALLRLRCRAACLVLAGGLLTSCSLLPAASPRPEGTAASQAPQYYSESWLTDDALHFIYSYAGNGGGTNMLMEQFQSVIQFPCSREEPGAKRP